MIITIKTRKATPIVCSSLIAALLVFSASAATTIGTFTGGDPGEGLDLQGRFIYAFNVGTPGAAGKAGDADFTADNASGITVMAGNQIPNWHVPEYGDSPNDEVIETVMKSIRWSAAPDTVRVNLARLVPGTTYKLQLLFAEQCCAGRAFDVRVEGVNIADEFNPAGIQEGAGNTSQGVVVTHDFVAADDALNIILDGPGITTPEFNDHNAILSGVTLELISAPGDTDGDGLADAWENLHFKNLAQLANGDPDGDGLNNAAELTAGTNPNLADSDSDGLNDAMEVNTTTTDPNAADTDRDGLKDGEEVNLHGTNPKLADTDGDGLSDGDEINKHKSNPKLADSDGDGFNDLSETLSRTDPANKNHIPRGLIIGRFTGGDAGEGLDLDGTFAYALNVGTPGAAGKVRDADFAADDSLGITVATSNEIPSWHQPNYGDTPNDDALEIVMQSIRWSNAASADQPSVNVDLAGVKIGQRYKLQLLFAEQCCANRAFDVFVEGAQIADEFNPAGVQGGAGNVRAGVFLSFEVTAKDDTMNIVLDGRSITTPAFTDHNAILSGVTLEQLNLGPDSDNDGLPDAWEMSVFGNLSQSGTGDADNDGLSNSVEFELASNANDADTDDDGLNDGVELNTHKTGINIVDSDSDGLSDGAEVNTHGTNPTRADSDGDGLTDGAELTVHKTNPKLADTDGDGFEDGQEITAKTDPTSASSVPPAAVTRVRGGDVGEGLDLEGKFAYAFNVGPNGAIGKIRDADFTADDAPGITVTAGNQIEAFSMPSYGDSPNDDLLEMVMQSIRWSNAASAAQPSVNVDLDNIRPGTRYQVQLLFAEGCCANRAFDVSIEGVQVARELNVATFQGGVTRSAGVVLTYRFNAGDTTLNIVLDGRGVTNPAFTDHNAILSGVTIEELGEAPPPSAKIALASVKRTATSLTFNFDTVSGKKYAVEFTETLTNPSWTKVGGDISASANSTAFTDTDAGRLGRRTGYYRVRNL